MPKTASSKTSARSTPYQTRSKTVADKNKQLETVADSKTVFDEATFWFQQQWIDDLEEKTCDLAYKNKQLEEFYENEKVELEEKNEELEEKVEELEEKNDNLISSVIALDFENSQLKDEVSRLAYGNYCLAGQNGL